MRALINVTIVAALLGFTSAWAQSPPVQPATSAPSEQPAVASPSSTTAIPKTTEKGTTVVGDTDSPIGLFIMPWRNSSAEKDIDRPARLLQGDMSPIDQVVFDRQTEYFDVLEAHAKKTGGPSKP